MLFNSYEFIFAFLPLAVCGFYGVSRWFGATAARAWMVLASLVFYAAWDPVYLPVLLASVSFNYFAAALIARSSRKRLLVGLAVFANLAFLGYFKYANFLVDNFDAVTGTHHSIGKIVLPLALSFHTFQQIAYVVDAGRGAPIERHPIHYLLFVTFFPQLIAGPIVHHSELLPQFKAVTRYRMASPDVVAGVTLFIIGLWKKCVLADTIGPEADRVFEAAGDGVHVTFIEAWTGALAYTVQLYFDFSGYSDMAIGAARLFGIRLPVNFDSPYKAQSLVDFWRRWHITLSRFLRDYLYIPLGGNRRGELRRYTNLLITMLLGGLWHGAGWNFVIWGGVHGVGLAANHLWSSSVGERAFTATRWYRAAGWATTMVVVVAAWVFFRARTLEGATSMLTSMAGLRGIDLPHRFAAMVPFLGPVLATNAIRSLVDSTTYLLVATLFAAALLLPNSQELLSQGAGAPSRWGVPGLRFSPTRAWAIALGAMAALSVLCLTRVSAFLYFQF